MLFKKEELPPALQRDEHGVTQMPKGFHWCKNCQALTPHEPVPWFRSKCMLCGIIAFNHSSGCKNCKAPEPDGGHQPGYGYITVHKPGCHFKDVNVTDDRSFLPWAMVVAADFKKDFFRPFPDRESFSLPKDIKWYKGNQRLSRIWRERVENVSCDCPRYPAYFETNVFNSVTRSVYSMDCINALEWQYEWRCPVCGFINFVQDGNC